ncbi:hypothetical protein Bca101_014069 [Brassica carinata]
MDQTYFKKTISHLFITILEKLEVGQKQSSMICKLKLGVLPPRNELQWELRSDGQSDEMETTDLQDELNKKIPNLRAKLKRRKTNSPVDKLEPIILYQRKNPDLRTRLNFLRAERTARPKEQPQRLNVILGGSPLAKILSGP